MPAVAQRIDVLVLAPGSTIGCDPTREVVIVTAGEALLETVDRRPIAIIGPCRAVGPLDGSATSRYITAVSNLHCVVVTRRELPSLLTIAPGVVAAIDAAVAVPAPGRSLSRSV
jgi:hypothetical protein